MDRLCNLRMLFLPVFMFWTACTTVKLGPTGKVNVSKDDLGMMTTFRKLREPSIDRPYFEIALGKARQVKRVTSSEYRFKTAPTEGFKIINGLSGLSGLIMALAALDYPEEGSDEDVKIRDQKLFWSGVGLFGFGMITWLATNDNKGRTYTKFVETTDVYFDFNGFQPLSGKPVLIESDEPHKKWRVLTDEVGVFKISASEVLPEMSTVQEVRLTVKAQDGVRTDVSFSSSFLRRYTEYLKNLKPAGLITQVAFDDSDSWAANQIIDGAENAALVVTVQNRGEGRGLEVRLGLDCDNSAVAIQEQVYLGTIEPGQTIKKRIPLQADMDIDDGLATFTVYTKEQRGYDARPVKLRVRTRRLEKPALAFTTFKINDGTTGMASGNNNGVAESAETLEISAFVRNSGPGPARNAHLQVTTSSAAIQIRKGEDDLQTVAPGETRQGKTVIHIPRTFAENEIRLQFSARDMLGASVVDKEYRLPVKVRAPILAFDYAIFTSEGVQVNQVSNGEEYQLEITPRNDGTLNANNVEIVVSAPSGVRLREGSHHVALIASGASASHLLFPFSLPRTFNTDRFSFEIRMTQSEFSPVHRTVTVPFLLRKPQLTAQTRFLSATGKNTILQGDYGELNLVVQNNGNLSAEGVVATLEISDAGIDLLEPRYNFGRIPPGATVPHKFKFYVKNSARTGSYVSTLRISQADGFPGFQKTLTFNVEEVGAVVVEVTGEEDVENRSGYPSIPGGAFNQPPRVKVKALGVNEMNQTFEPYVKIQIGISDDKPILGLEPEILVNNKRQTKEMLLRGITKQERQQASGDNELTLVRQIPLSEGLNEIKVSFLDSDNLSDTDRIRVEYRTSRANVYALVVGVSEYASADVEPLKYAHKDAQRFANFLQSPAGGNVPRANIRILTNREATRSNILNSLKDVLGKALENDVVYLYMAMHAVPDRSGYPLFFLTYDSDPNDLLSTGIEQALLQGQLQNRIRSNKVVWIADACHTGTIGSDTIATRASRANLTNRLLREMAKARNGLALFMAASANQTSQEGDRWGGGVFTYYLLKGLQGEADQNQDGFVSLNELARFIRRAVVEATNGAQHPQVYGNYDGGLTVGMVKEAAAK